MFRARALKKEDSTERNLTREWAEPCLHGSVSQVLLDHSHTCSFVCSHNEDYLAHKAYLIYYLTFTEKTKQNENKQMSVYSLLL